MGIARKTNIVQPAVEPKKPRKKRVKSGTGDWVQVNLRLRRKEYNLFVTAAKEKETTAPGLAKMLVDDYMKGFAPHKVYSEEARGPDT